MPKKHYPVVRSAELVNNSTTSNTYKLLQVDRELSKLNKRMYRQTRAYEVKIDLNPAADTDQISVYALRNDWPLHKAVQMAYSVYRQATEQERAHLGSNQLARWEDFRINHGLETVQYDLLFSALRSRDLQAAAFGAGEFPLSNVVDKNGVEKTFTLGTQTGTTYDIIGNYDSSANMQDAPEDTVSGAYTDLEADVDSLTMQNLQNDGNQPPYNGDSMSSQSPWVLVARIGTSLRGNRLSTGFFTAPLGMVAFSGSAGFTPNDLQYTVQKGDYKGVNAPSMLE